MSQLRVRALAPLLAAAVGLVGCGEGQAEHRQAEAVDDGVQVTGVLDGSRVAVSQGVPDVLFGDCDPGDGLDEDVCWVARTIDGLSIAFVVENPAVLVAGEVVEVVPDACRKCDEVTEGVVVDVRVDGEQRRATAGRIEVREVGERIAADIEVRWPDGDHLVGSFNVRELRPEEQ